jgi:autoinducer 2-degrading protein
MFTVFVTLDVKPGCLPEFLEAVTENAADSLRLEEGCSVFDVLQSVSVSNRIHLYEVYANEEAFEVGHKGTEHFHRFIARSTPLIVPGSKTELHAGPVSAETTEPAHDH